MEDFDPHHITKFDCSDTELQQRWLFGILAAGKPASRMARLLNHLMRALPGGTPFDKIAAAEAAGQLLPHLLALRVGQYRRVHAAFRASPALDLRRASLEDLQAAPGVGPKTARMFLLHTRPNARVAVLDTHILKHLAQHGHAVPKATPGNRNHYRRLEAAFLDLADRSGMTPAEYDLTIWKTYARAA